VNIVVCNVESPAKNEAASAPANIINTTAASPGSTHQGIWDAFMCCYFLLETFPERVY
jgi:hypothetical protein